MTAERRRFSRHMCALPVELEERGQSIRMVTADISRHGAFLLTDSPRHTTELLRLRFDLGDHGHIEVMAQVARHVPPSEDSPTGTGMGVDFFTLSGEAKERWDVFVEDLSAQHDPTPSVGRDQTWRPVRRRHARHRSCFLVRVREKDGLRAFYTRDIGAGGMFLSTPTPDDTEREIDVVLVHPHSEQEYPLTARVVRVANSDSSPERGVAVAFERLSTSEEVALLAFIETGVNYLDPFDSQQQRREQLQVAARVAPRSTVATVALGEALLASGDTKLAINAYRSALTIDPACGEAHHGLYRAYQALQQHDRAAEHLADFRKLAGGDSP
jgi:Tfp pilus assembly protein PilF